MRYLAPLHGSAHIIDFCFEVILGLATTGAFTQFTKIMVGRPRPGKSLSFPPQFLHTYRISTVLDIISRCQPTQGATDPPLGLSTSGICTQTDAYIMKDGFRSFFSGHSSCETHFIFFRLPVFTFHPVSFAGLGFLSLYLAGKLHLFDRRGHAVSVNHFNSP